ncbi:MAG: TIGR01459 family HAD-type hydrolase [Pseudomonadota bacterium]
MTLEGAERIASLSDVSGRFDAYLIDQFGVLHDGVRPYPGAIAALRGLKETGARIALVSNSGKRAASNIARLRKLGFPDESYDAFITSGEVAWSLLRSGAVYVPAGANVLHIARGEDRSALEGLDLSPTDDPEACDLVLIAGSEAERVLIEAYEARLAEPASRRVPALCTNPDIVMLTADGPRFGAGEIARRYEAMGSRVTWIGKPYPAIYEAAMDALGHPDPLRTLCIGDSLEHDIAGGQSIGAQTLLVTGGIPLDEAAAERIRPTYVAPAFR